MIILPSTLALMLALLVYRFGKAGLTRLASIEFRDGHLVVLACLIQMASVATHARRFWLLLASTALLLTFCALNRRRAGIALAIAGIVLNFVVMGANGGTMPISPATLRAMHGPDAAPGTELSRSKDRVVHDAQARLPILGDRLLLPGPLARLAAWSIGDVLLLAGVFRLLWHTMKGTHHHEPTFSRRATPSGA